LQSVADILSWKMKYSPGEFDMKPESEIKEKFALNLSPLIWLLATNRLENSVNP
jgi:hypothetical protein